MFRKKVIILMLILVIIIFISGVIIMESRQSIKTAITKNNISNDCYIICKPVLVTGYYWQVIEDETGSITPTYCIIKGVDPEKLLSLKYEFMTAGNKFVFYPTEKKEYYSDELKESVVEYIVNDWDILFPVKHGKFKDIIIPISWHIVESDCE